MAGAIYNREFDVVICGGGVSGCTAAIAAARSGARTSSLPSSGRMVKATRRRRAERVMTGGSFNSAPWFDR